MADHTVAEAGLPALLVVLVRQIVGVLPGQPCQKRLQAWLIGEQAGSAVPQAVEQADGRFKVLSAGRMLPLQALHQMLKRHLGQIAGEAVVRDGQQAAGPQGADGQFPEGLLHFAADPAENAMADGDVTQSAVIGFSLCQGQQIGLTKTDVAQSG